MGIADRVPAITLRHLFWLGAAETRRARADSIGAAPTNLVGIILTHSLVCAHTGSL